MGCGVCHRPPADEAVAAIDANVVLVAKGRDSIVTLRPSIFSGFGLRELHRPARNMVLRAQFGRLVQLRLGDLASLEICLLVLSVALPGCGHELRVNDRAALGEIPGL